MDDSNNRPIDQRNKLDDEPFDYKVLKDNKVQISWFHKDIMLLKGDQALKILKKLELAKGKEIQLILAKATGNFKHGNEKDGKRK